MKSSAKVLLAIAFVALQAAQAWAVPLVLPNDIARLASEGSNPDQRNKVIEALDALDRNDIKSAEKAFRDAMAIDRKQPIPYLGMAEIAAMRNDSSAVDSWLKKATVVAPKDVSVLRSIAGVQVRRGQLKEAQANLKSALTIDPRNVAANIQLAELYLLGLKQPAAAEAAYRTALATDPNAIDAQLGLGAALAAQVKVEATIAAFETAAKLAPQDPRGLHSLARFFASQAKFDLALATLDRTLLAAPGYEPAMFDRGDLLLATNQVEKAVVAFSDAAKTAKRPAKAKFRLGVSYEALQRWDEAERAYLDAVKSDPKFFAAYNNLAFMMAGRKLRLDDALSWAKKAIELAPKDSTLQDTVGWVYRARGELDLAVRAIQKAVAGSPNQANFHYHLGVVYDDQHKSTEAIAALQKALALNKNMRYAADAESRLKRLTGKG